MHSPQKILSKIFSSNSQISQFPHKITQKEKDLQMNQKGKLLLFIATPKLRDECHNDITC
jgi:hypothetical protein